VDIGGFLSWLFEGSFTAQFELGFLVFLFLEPLGWLFIAMALGGIHLLVRGYTFYGATLLTAALIDFMYLLYLSYLFSQFRLV
jgi:hypothetical protein